MKYTSFLMLFGLLSLQAIAQDAPQTSYVNEQGAPFSGLYHMSNDANVLVYSANVENGILNGVITYFDADGRIDQVGHYSKGLKEGKWEQYNDQGRLIGEAFYAAGQKHGIWSVWDDNGNKRYHMVYDQGNKVDVWKVYDENQILVSEKIYKK
jgi:antitoxin component YwqK of YwqJK toxin-antitoxin module